MVTRDKPYAQFNFLVSVSGGSTDGADGGFQECSNLGTELAGAQYRRGNDPENSVRKIAGLNKATDVTLKRGVMSSPSLRDWLNEIRQSNQNTGRTVIIRLQNEDHTGVVQTWKLIGARIIKHVSGPLNAKGTDVAMEELALSCERVEVG